MHTLSLSCAAGNWGVVKMSHEYAGGCFLPGMDKKSDAFTSSSLSFNHPYFGDMLIGHLLPGVIFMFLPPSLPLTLHSALWVYQRQKCAHTCMTTKRSGHPCSHFMRVNLCNWQDAHMRMQHIEVVAIKVVEGWSCKASCETKSIKETWNFQAVNMRYTGCSPSLQMQMQP